MTFLLHQRGLSFICGDREAGPHNALRPASRGQRRCSPTRPFSRFCVILTVLRRNLIKPWEVGVSSENIRMVLEAVVWFPGVCAAGNWVSVDTQSSRALRPRQHFVIFSQRQKPSRSRRSDAGVPGAQLRSVSASRLSLFDRSSHSGGTQVSKLLARPGLSPGPGPGSGAVTPEVRG